MLMGLNTVYLCQLQGDTMLIDGPRYRYHMLNPSSGIGAPFSPHDMFSFIVACFYVSTLHLNVVALLLTLNCDTR